MLICNNCNHKFASSQPLNVKLKTDGPKCSNCNKRNCRDASKAVKRTARRN